jgi:hypothetical protein
MVQAAQHFAQFERELGDKFAASRAKGMWMGGTVAVPTVNPKQLVDRRAERSESAVPSKSWC